MLKNYKLLRKKHRILVWFCLFVSLISILLVFNYNSTLNYDNNNSNDNIILNEKFEKILDFQPDSNLDFYSSSKSLDDFQILESADPLELGGTEIITLMISNPSNVNKVLIEYEGKNYRMKNIGNGQWEHDSWEPSSTGEFTYIISGENNSGKIFNITDTIEVIDTILPDYSELKENKDPLELGKTETITIKVTDLSGINQVLIEFGGINHSMTDIGEKKWKYDTWTPLNIGTYPYTIFMEDNNGNWNSLSDSIIVGFDTTPPIFTKVKKSKDPLNLGESLIIDINVTDSHGINQVLIEIEGLNHTMDNVIGDKWEYNCTPSSSGVYSFSIYMEDNYNNWNSTSEVIEVINVILPEQKNNDGSGGDSGSGGSSNGASQNDSDDSIMWVFVAIICSSTSVIVGIVTMKKFKSRSKQINKKLNPKNKKGSVESQIPNENKEAQVKSSLIPNLQRCPLSVICPICKFKKTILVPKSIIDDAKSLSTLSIPKRLVCEHHFQIFVDKNFKVRGYQKVDFEFNGDIFQDFQIYERKIDENNEKLN